MDEIEVEIIHLELLELSGEDFIYLGHIPKVVARELGGKAKALPGVLFQRLAHHQLGIAVVIAPGGVEVVDPMGQGIVHHLLGGGGVYLRVVAVNSWQAHGPHAKGREF